MFINMSHYGIRGPEFINYVANILTLGQLKPEYVDLLTNEEAMSMYDAAFTSKFVNPENNYEFLEFLGDSTMNKIIVWYFARRFPQLANKENVKTLARIKINMVSMMTFAKIGRDIQVPNYITCTEEEWEKHQSKLTEDTLEAFIGAIEYQVDLQVRQGAGYAICYNIITPLLDKIDISLAHEDLYDAVTRLKEVFDAFQKVLGKMEYKTMEDESAVDRFRVQVVLQKNDGQRAIIGEGIGKSKKAASIISAEAALSFLAKRGFVRIPPNENTVPPLPPNAQVNTENHGNYFTVTVSHNGRRAVGVGFTPEEAKDRAQYNLARQ